MSGFIAVFNNWQERHLTCALSHSSQQSDHHKTQQSQRETDSALLTQFIPSWNLPGKPAGPGLCDASSSPRLSPTSWPSPPSGRGIGIWQPPHIQALLNIRCVYSSQAASHVPLKWLTTTLQWSGPEAGSNSDGGKPLPSDIKRMNASPPAPSVWKCHKVISWETLTRWGAGFQGIYILKVQGTFHMLSYQTDQFLNLKFCLLKISFYCSSSVLMGNDTNATLHLSYSL